MHLFHALKGLLVKDKDLKKDIANLLAVSIFTDSLVRNEEVKTAYSVLESLFDGDDYEYLVEEVDIHLEDFQENAINYITARDKAVEFIKNSGEDKEHFLNIIKIVFKCDSELHRKEEEILDLFKNGKEKKNEK